jgi:hypothetical protein
MVVPERQADQREGEESRVEREIHEAQKRGEFRRLKNEGRPVDLRRNPNVKPDMEMAFKLLKDAGFAPDWIEADKAARTAVQQWRASLRQAWREHQETIVRIKRGLRPYTDMALAEREWQQDQRRLREALVEVNRLVDALNLRAPTTSTQRLRLDFDYEARRVMLEEAAREPGRPAPEEDADRSAEVVRKAVLSRETVPRPPAWARAFRRAVLQRARKQAEGDSGNHSSSGSADSGKSQKKR